MERVSQTGELNAEAEKKSRAGRGEEGTISLVRTLGCWNETEPPFRRATANSGALSLSLFLSQFSSKRSLAVLLFLRHLNPSTSPLPQTWFLVLIHVLCQSPFTQDCHVSLFLLFHFIIVSGVLFPPPCPLFLLFNYHLGPHCPKTKTLREVKKKWEERIERIQRIQWMCGVTRTKALDSHRYGHSSY